MRTRLLLAEDLWVSRYLRAVHLGRIGIAIAALVVACMTYGEIPTRIPWTIVFAIIGLVWVSAIALLARPLGRLLDRRPRLIWIDTAVLVGLMLIDRPVDSMVAMPYGAFGLLVPFVAPLALTAAVCSVVVLGYMPRIVAHAVDWQYADLVPPTNTLEWATIYVGPVFAGSISIALCVLMRGVRGFQRERIRVEQEAQTARDAAYDAQARRAIVEGIHSSISLTVRLVPLVVAKIPEDERDAQTVELREELIETAGALREEFQTYAKTLIAPAPAPDEDLEPAAASDKSETPSSTIADVTGR